MEIKPITDKKMWNNFLMSHYSEHYPFFQTWEWGNVQRELGNRVYDLGLFKNSEIISLIQIVEIKAKRGHYLFWRHGPVIPEFSKEKFNYILAYIKNMAKEKSCSFIRVSRFFLNDQMNSNLLKELGFTRSPLQTIDAEFCWTLDITKSEEELLKGMRKSHRYLVKKAQSLEINIKKSVDIKDMDIFLPLYKKLAQRQHFITHKGLREEFATFSKENQVMLFFAQYQKHIISAAFIIFVGGVAIYRHGASDEAYRTIPASYLLQWEAILEAKKRKKTLYNFWGIAPEGAKKHPWSGLTLFKTGFGGKYEYFLPIMDLPLSIAYWRTYIIDLITKLRR